jgi:hypothetical protein
MENKFRSSKAYLSTYIIKHKNFDIGIILPVVLYCCERLPPALREEYELLLDAVLQNTAVRGTF